jgi:hypothetical protein
MVNRPISHFFLTCKVDQGKLSRAKGNKEACKKAKQGFPLQKAEGSCKRQGTNKGPTIFSKGK